MDISIRKASLDDARELALLLRGIGWFEAFNSGQIDELAARVRNHLQPCLANESHSTFVAEDPTGVIAGYSSVHCPPGWASESTVMRESFSSHLKMLSRPSTATRSS